MQLLVPQVLKLNEIRYLGSLLGCKKPLSGSYTFRRFFLGNIMIYLLRVPRPIWKLKIRKGSAESANNSQRTRKIMDKELPIFQRKWVINHLKLKL